MFRRSICSRHTCRIILTHIVVLLACTLVCCICKHKKKQKTPKEKLKRAFKELEGKIEL